MATFEEASMQASEPLICHHCWAKKRNHYGPCEHATQVWNAGAASKQRGFGNEWRDFATLSDRERANTVARSLSLEEPTRAFKVVPAK